MDQVTFSIEENVPIMSVLHTEQVVEQRISSETFNEILLCFFKFLLVILFKENLQIPWFLSFGELLFQSIDGNCVWYEVNNA
jgi:hypothetical protein